MNITQYIPASLILGSVLVASTPPVWAEEQGVGSVELIPFPEGTTDIGNLSFSHDGELQMLQLYSNSDSDIYHYQGNQWHLIRRELRTIVPGIAVYGVSEGAKKFVLSDHRRVDVVEGVRVTTLPREWCYTNSDGRERRVYGSTGGGYISADTSTVTLSGYDYEINESDSLIWNGGEELINISDGLPRGEITYYPGIPSDDGQVIAFGSTFHGSHNNIRHLWSSRGDVWVWDGGDPQMVPKLQPGYDVLMQLEDISGNGEVVIGHAAGLWASLGAFDEPLTDQSSGLQHGPTLSWVWTEAEGTREITDSRFSSINLLSIDHDASIALGIGDFHDGGFDHFLWFRDGQILLLNDLLHVLKLEIHADWFGLDQISSDGTKLSGIASVNGRYHAIIVTIPDLTP